MHQFTHINIYEPLINIQGPLVWQVSFFQQVILEVKTVNKAGFKFNI